MLIFLLAMQTYAASPNADNTKVNERITSHGELTAQDQGSSKADTELTANIRQAVMDTDLSLNAKNIKIISLNGIVTLKGPVKSAAEKQKLEQIAVAKAGMGKVANQIEIAQ